MSSDDRFIPFSKRRADADERAAFLEPRDGVPDYLKPSLRNWMVSTFAELVPSFRGTLDGWELDTLLARLERKTERTFLRRESPDGTMNELKKAVWNEPELFLDIVDALLSVLGPRSGAIGGLGDILDEGGSLFRVSRSDGQPRLEERIDPTMRDVASSALEGGARPAEHLRKAWTAAFTRGNQERASEAYREAVRAVEAALRPIASPNNDRATLGTMIRDIKQAPQNFSVRMGGLPGDHAVEAFAEHLNQLWKSQLDRHGTDDEDTPIRVTPDQAKDAVVFAVSIVQVIQSGGFARIDS